MNVAIAESNVSSLYELAAYKFVASLKLVNLDIKTLDQLQINKKSLVYRKISKIINEEPLFRDIQSRVITIKQFKDYDARQEAIKEQAFKPGPAAFIRDSPSYYQEDDLSDIETIEQYFYNFVISPSFVHKNKYYSRYISRKIIELHKSKIDSCLIISILLMIDTIEILEIHKNNELDTMKNIVEIIKLVEAKKITDSFMISCFSNEIYNLANSADGELVYTSFLTVYKKYFQLGLENQQWETFSLPRRHQEAFVNPLLD